MINNKIKRKQKNTKNTKSKVESKPEETHLKKKRKKTKIFQKSEETTNASDT